jgi:hypothetical protein
MQRRLAWPLRKDDTQNREAFHMPQKITFARHLSVEKIWSQSYKTMISLLFQFLLLSLAILKYKQYFLKLQTLNLNNKNGKNLSFTKKKVR